MWKPFRAVAAAMLVLVMATACQETAQQVIQSSAKAPVALTETTQGNTTAQSSISLNEAELALVKKVDGDKDIAAMNVMHKTIIFKMKIAIGHDKEKFKQAIINKDSKTFAELMNFSESEYAEFSTKFQQHLSNFKVRYAADMGTIENFKKRNPEQCKSCQNASSNSASAILDEQLAKIEKANVGIGSMDQIQAFDENTCRRDNPMAYNQFKFLETLAYTTFGVCNVIALASFQYWIIPICFALWAVEMVSAMCATCGCPQI